jgi:OOP family OmpA-OmpF porin
VDSKGCPPPKQTLGEVTAAGTYVFKDIQFESNKADLKSSSFATLNSIAEALKAQPDMKVEIQGHTDGRGKRDFNVGLSQRRAETVKAYLVTKGVDSERMVPRGYGPDHPIATNSTAQGRATNRRVEFKPIR